MKNPIQQLFGQTAVYGMGIVLPRLLNYLLLTPFYTRVFAPAEYGIITELYAYVVFLLVILTYGMETGFFRYASHEQEKDRVFSTILASLFLTSGLFVLGVSWGAEGIAGWLDYGGHPEYIRWLACIVGLDAFTSIPFARIRLQNKPLKYALIRLAEVSINIGLNLFFLYYCPRHTDAALVQWIYVPSVGVGYVLISNLAASLLKLLLLAGDIRMSFRFRVDPALWRTIFRYAYPLLIAGLAGTVNEALDRILLKHLIPEELDPMVQLGIYGANFKMAVLMTLFVQMFKYAAEPFFFSKSQDKEAPSLYADVMSFFVVAGLLIFLVVNFFLDTFILFIGPGFREGVYIVPVVLMANLIMGVFFNLSIWYKLTNKTMVGAALVLIGALITLLINVFFIPEYGYRASAWAHLICYSVMVVLSYLWSRKHYAIPYPVGKILSYMGLAVLLYLLNTLFLQDAGPGAFLLRLCFMLLFAGVAWYREMPVFMKYKDVSTHGSENT